MGGWYLAEFHGWGLFFVFFMQPPLLSLITFIYTSHVLSNGQKYNLAPANNSKHSKAFRTIQNIMFLTQCARRLNDRKRICKASPLLPWQSGLVDLNIIRGMQRRRAPSWGSRKRRRGGVTHLHPSPLPSYSHSPSRTN